MQAKSFWVLPFLSLSLDLKQLVLDGQGVTRAHTLESQVHTILHHFFKLPSTMSVSVAKENKNSRAKCSQEEKATLPTAPL